MYKKMYFLIVSLCIAFVLLSGCLGYTISKTNDESPVAQPTYQKITDADASSYNTAPQINPIKITKDHPQSWGGYSNYRDGFKIYKPSNWDVSINSEDYGSVNTRGVTLLEDVYILSPTANGAIGIFAKDYTGTIWAVPTSQTVAYITNTDYNARVNSLFSESDTYSYSNIVRDTSYYTLNGNPVRFVSGEMYDKRDGSTKDAYVIFASHGSVDYTIAYLTMSDATISEKNIAKDIMYTFETL